MGFKQFCKDNFVAVSPKKLNKSDLHNVEISVEDDPFKKSAVIEDKKLDVESSVTDSSDSFRPHRDLKNRHIQLIGIGGTIGTAIFVSISGALFKGGPLSLFLGFTIWCIPILAVTASTAEMVSYLPITSPFIRMAGICCDDALEFVSGLNFWILTGSLIPYEIVGVNTIIHYWSDDYSPAITICIQIVLYFLINLFSVSIYGETEFWLSVWKVCLAVGLMFFTLVTMSGGNPLNDAYGYRNWNSPSPMMEYIGVGALGRFQGFVACLSQACFTISGPDYVSSVAGESANPRKTLPTAFKQVFYRLTFIFIIGVLCIGTVCSPRDPHLIAALEEGRPGSGSSPYVIAMDNLKIKVLPHIVNGALALSAFSSGNSYTYCSSRVLYGLAYTGKAPKIFAYCTKSGIPLYSVLMSLCWAFLSFLEMNTQSQIVLVWIINLVTSSQLLNYTITMVTYTRFYAALKHKGIDRRSLPFYAWFQPYTAIFGGFCTFSMIFISQYLLFYPSREYWAVSTFLFAFLSLFIIVALFIAYKLVFRTKWKSVDEIDWEIELQEVERDQAYFDELAHYGNNSKKPWYDKIIAILVGNNK
ncbi:BA75_05213T0 [Komagataella pastoris]|uniref:BA75_05213T0 n=1 Tax=Komagataella pastoris TaxID=4922 RepID=A0A1B2JHR1_PICPA|nr:BA75_05213T0 [Komagataella pastoris]